MAKKHGHPSLNGAVTAISYGKCVDAIVLSKYCRQCQICERKKDSEEYKNSIQNYYGSSIKSNTNIDACAGATVYAMKKSIAAILHHCTEFETEERYTFFVHQAPIHGVNTK